MDKLIIAVAATLASCFVVALILLTTLSFFVDYFLGAFANYLLLGSVVVGAVAAILSVLEYINK